MNVFLFVLVEYAVMLPVACIHFCLIGYFSVIRITMSSVTDSDSTMSVDVLIGVAGSVATVLHDGIMNPAEGKKMAIK